DVTIAAPQRHGRSSVSGAQFRVCRATDFRRTGGASSGPLRDSALPAAYDGVGAAPAGQSLTDFRVSDALCLSAVWADALHRTGEPRSRKLGVRHQSRICLAPGAFHQRRSLDSSALVRWILFSFHRVPVSVSGTIRRKDPAVGKFGAGWAVAILLDLPC